MHVQKQLLASATILALFLTSACESQRDDPAAKKSSDADIHFDPIQPRSPPSIGGNSVLDPTFAAAPPISTPSAGPNEEADSTLFGAPKQFTYPRDGVVMGQGWDSFTEKGTQAQCVEVAEVAIESSSFDTSVEEIKSTYSLLKEKSVLVSVAGSYGGASGSASTSSTRSTKLETDLANVLFSFVASTGSTRAIGVGGAESPLAGLPAVGEGAKGTFQSSHPAAQTLILQLLAQQPREWRGSTVRLTSEAEKLLEDTGKFQRICGDGFVSAIHRGSRVRVLATFRSRAEKEKATFRANLTASGFGVSGSTSYSTSRDESKLDEKITYKITQEGGIPFAPPQNFSDLKGMFSKTENFIEKPGAFEVTMTPYAALINYPSGVTLESPARLKRLGDYYIVLSDLYVMASEILRYALDPKLESPYDPKMIIAYGGVQHSRAVKDAIHTDLKILEEGITNCYRDKTGCNEAGVKEATTRAAEQQASDLEKLSNEMEKDLKAVNEHESKGDTAGAAAVLSKTVRSEVKVEDVTAAVAELEASQKAVLAQVASLKDITGILGEPGTRISESFFQRFFSYLIEIPLAEEQFSLSLNPEDDVPAIENTVGELGKAILLSRLIPWKEYFCQEAMSEYLCVHDEQLFNLVNSASLDFIKLAISIEIGQYECEYFLGNRRISESQHRMLGSLQIRRPSNLRMVCKMTYAKEPT